jgi:hypothetical protein
MPEGDPNETFWYTDDKRRAFYGVVLMLIYCPYLGLDLWRAIREDIRYSLDPYNSRTMALIRTNQDLLGGLSFATVLRAVGALPFNLLVCGLTMQFRVLKVIRRVLVNAAESLFETLG